MIIRSGLGLSFGIVFSVLLFKRRAWPAWVGLGFGAGRAWEEADGRSFFYTFLFHAPGLIQWVYSSGVEQGISINWLTWCNYPSQLPSVGVISRLQTLCLVGR